MVPITQDYLTQQYIASTGSYDTLGGGYMSTSFNPYSSVFSPMYGPCGGNVQGYETYNNQCTDSNVRMTQKNTAATSLMDAPEKAISRRMGVLQRQIQSGNQDNIKEEYDKLYDEVKTMYEEAGYPDVSDSQIRAYIDEQYTSKTQSRIIDDMNKYGKDDFTHSFLQGTGVGALFEDKTSKSDNISYMYGEKKSVGAKAADWTGRILGAAATLLALPLVAKLGTKLLPALAKGYTNILCK